MARNYSCDKPEYRAKLSERRKALWKDPAYREKVLAKRDEFWKNNPEGREIERLVFLDKMKNPDFIKRKREGQNKYWTAERRKKESEKFIEMNKNKVFDSETRKQISARQKEMWKQPGFKEQMRLKLSDAWSSDRLSKMQKTIKNAPRGKRGEFLKRKVVDGTVAV